MTKGRRRDDHGLRISRIISLRPSLEMGSDRKRESENGN